MILLGSSTLCLTLHNRNLALFGTPVVSDESMPDVIRREILERDPASGMALYHKMRPELTMKECQATVQRWAHQLQKNDPRPFEKPISHRLSITQQILGTLGVALWLTCCALALPIAKPFWWLSAALTAVLCGLGGYWGTGTTSLKKRLGVSLPGAIALTTLLAINDFKDLNGISFTGFLCGLTSIVVTFSVMVHRRQRL